MTRGMMSSGNARSSPPMSKVTPCSRYAAVSASARARTSEPFTSAKDFASAR